jgi:hypothetical protein
VGVVVQIRARGNDPVDEAGLEPALSKGIRQLIPRPAGVSAPASVIPTVQSGSRNF